MNEPMPEDAPKSTETTENASNDATGVLPMQLLRKKYARHAHWRNYFGKYNYYNIYTDRNCKTAIVNHPSKSNVGS